VNVAGGNITTHHTTSGLSPAEIKQLFDQIYAAIETRAETSSADKEDLKAEVKEIQSRVTEGAQKNEKVDERFLLKNPTD
jgi:cell division septum initiation protein DivIVA